MARVYGGAAPKMTEKQATFVGAFASALPHDVGGDGHYLHWGSPLGRVSIYVERFRGTDDAVTMLEARRKTVDQLVDLVIGWFDSELHGEAEWPALRKFFDTTFRHDLQNLSLYGWLQHIRPDSESINPEIAFRVTQYFVERHYASYEEAPALLREFTGLENRDESAAFFAHSAGCCWPRGCRGQRTPGSRSRFLKTRTLRGLRGSDISTTRPITSGSTRNFGGASRGGAKESDSSHDRGSDLRFGWPKTPAQSRRRHAGVRARPVLQVPRSVHQDPF